MSEEGCLCALHGIPIHPIHIIPSLLCHLVVDRRLIFVITQEKQGACVLAHVAHQHQTPMHPKWRPSRTAKWDGFEPPSCPCRQLGARPPSPGGAIRQPANRHRSLRRRLQNRDPRQPGCHLLRGGGRRCVVLCVKGMAVGESSKPCGWWIGGSDHVQGLGGGGVHPTKGVVEGLAVVEGLVV